MRLRQLPRGVLAIRSPGRGVPRKCRPLIRARTCMVGQLARINDLEDVANGIEQAPAQFAKLMRGENFGKTLFRV